MRKNAGLSLLELMTVIAIIAILAAIAIPSMMGSRSRSKLTGVVDNLKGDLQLAKLAAVRDNGPVAVLFSDEGYQVFTDGGTEGTRDAGDRLLRNRQLPGGVSIDLISTDFSGNAYARFNNRGLPDSSGSVEVVGSDGDRQIIELNRLGRINVQ
jgi:type IV fimbrial biogenesis protein FimT